MIQLFRYLIETTDHLGNHTQAEINVLARDEEEAHEEITEYFALHEEIKSWCVANILEVAPVAEDSQHARDYGDKGAHSYISWL